MRTLLSPLLVLLSLSVSAQSFEVMPSVVIEGTPSSVILRSSDNWLCNPPIWCGVASVTIGGVQSPSVTTTQLTAEILVAVPDLPAGTVADVVVTDLEGNVRRAQAALRVVDPNAQFSPDEFERVLIPIIYDGPGQKGSQWTTEVRLMNGNTYTMPFLRGPQLAPEQSMALDVDAPTGYILFPAKGATDDLNINVLVRDLSRQSEALGTEIPAVRERDFDDRRIVLQNIPGDPRFRSTLRVYAFEALPHINKLSYWLHDMETGQEVAFGVVDLQFPRLGNQPWHGSVDLMAVHPQMANKGPMRLSIATFAANARFWGFVSVTNNETQHVTVISPNP